MLIILSASWSKGFIRSGIQVDRHFSVGVCVEQFPSEAGKASAPSSSVSDEVSTQIASPQLELEPIAGGQRGSEFDLVLTIFEEPKSLTGQWRYNTDLFDAGSVIRMTSHFRNLLEGITANPDRHLSEFSLLTEPERHQLLVDWNDTKRDYPKEKAP